jgi:hypothetical protein
MSKRAFLIAYYLPFLICSLFFHCISIIFPIIADIPIYLFTGQVGPGLEAVIDHVRITKNIIQNWKAKNVEFCILFDDKVVKSSENLQVNVRHVEEPDEETKEE